MYVFQTIIRHTCVHSVLITRRVVLRGIIVLFSWAGVVEVSFCVRFPFSMCRLSSAECENFAPIVSTALALLRVMLDFD